MIRSRMRAVPDGVTRALSMIEGHHLFMLANTGDTNDPTTDWYVANDEGVMSNNRHFIAWSQMEAQPNGDGTTESQSLEIVGYCYAYYATGDVRYLNEAKKYFDAYIEYFYAGQAIPDTPQRYICNWIVNSKQPVLANYPIDTEYPTHSGFKGVDMTFTNGNTLIPHGDPHWGEYLDIATFAFDGVLAWDAMNATVMGTLPDGSTDWSNPGKQYDVDWIIDSRGDQIDSGGDVLSSGNPAETYGTVQLKDTTVSGVHKLNYATIQPVEHGGYMIQRNQVQHNRPVHVPLLGGVNQMGNAADAEQWFMDCAYLLWKATGDDKYKKVMDCVYVTLREYAQIDAQDKYFRQSVYATTPYTDGIGYSFTYPDTVEVIYGRDEDGYITMASNAAAQEAMEQQAIWFRVDQGSKVLVTYGGVGATGTSVSAKLQILMSQVKADVPGTWWGIDLPQSTANTPQAYTFNISDLAQIAMFDGTQYLPADYRAATEYGGSSYTTALEDAVMGTRKASVTKALFPTSDAGLVLGFWLLDSGKSTIKSITIRTDAEFDLGIVDDYGWRWYWVLPNTNGTWQTVTLDPANLVLSGYQPTPGGPVNPLAPVFETVDQMTVSLETSTDVNKTFSYCYINDIPPVYTLDDGYTLKFRLTVVGTEAFNATIGDCTIQDQRDDALAYTPGVVPYSNIYVEGAMQLDAWHGMPYPGYQYPLIYCLNDDADNPTMLDNMVDFLYDSQQWYASQFKELGPVAAAYIWNRWDNAKYGPPDTWTMYNWGTDDAWAGYEPRAFLGGCRAWHELVMQGKTVPAKLVEYCENWLRWLIDFAPAHQGRTPTEFPPNSLPTAPDGDFTGHMTGLFLAGACFAAMAGSQVKGLGDFIEGCVVELQDQYPVNQGAEAIMNGGWTPGLRSGVNSMFFGFWSGEILRGLGAYVMYKSLPVGTNIYELYPQVIGT